MGLYVLCKCGKTYLITYWQESAMDLSGEDEIELGVVGIEV